MHAIATVSHPKFKLSPFNEEEKNMVSKLLLQEIRCEEKKSDTDVNSISPLICNSGKNDIFDVFASSAQKEADGDEMRHFLMSKNNTIPSINGFENIKNIFIKFNTPLPSSAAVE